LPTSMKPSGSIPAMHQPKTAAATHGVTRKSTTWRSPTSNEAIRLEPGYASA
jgi:hypothetical protein